MPRAVPVSKVSQASVMPSASLASPSICQFVGCTLSSVAAAMSPIASRPSIVLMFQVNATRSRQ